VGFEPRGIAITPNGTYAFIANNSVGDVRCIRTLCTAAAERGLRRLHGSILADNTAMIALLQRCGFVCTTSRYDARFVVAERQIGAPVAPSASPPVAIYKSG